MKFSYNWIRELVDGLDLPAAALERLITLKTAECEGIEPVGELLNCACLARVESVEPIAESHNVKAVVDAGRHGRKTVVCGAPNCRPGIVTVYVPSARRPSRAWKATACWRAPPNSASVAIMKESSRLKALPANQYSDAPPISSSKSITSPSPTGPTCGAITAWPAKSPPSREASSKDPAKLDLLPASAPGVKVSIENFDLCPRYSALAIENITVGPSPLWLQQRLNAIGLNPINNIVDMTNFVMAELAQPMHAFDADKLRGDTIFVRSARAGERSTHSTARRTHWMLRTW